MNTIYGTPSGEDLLGSNAPDRVFSGAGNDAIDGFDGDDVLYGEDGDDTIAAGAGNDRVYGGTGNDWLIVGFVGGIDVDRVWGGAGDDLISVNSFNGGEVYGGSGFDTLSMNLIAVNDAVAIALPGIGGATLTNPNGLLLHSVEALWVSTGRGDDTIFGGIHADHIEVRGGANVVNALGGGDVITYNTGSANLIDAGDGVDTLRVIHFVTDPLLFTVSGTSASDNFGSKITRTERFDVYGGSSADQVTLGARDDRFTAGDGDDLAYGRGGNDQLSGDRGNDNLSGGNGDDTLLGGVGNDVLNGGPGLDRLIGGDGDDTLVGAADRDILVGGRGADVFRFDGLAGTPDVIRDMSSGVDTIQIAPWLLGNALERGTVDAARFALDSAVGSQAQLVYVTDTGSAYGHLFWDDNGDLGGGQTLLVKLYASPALSVTDLFIV